MTATTKADERWWYVQELRSDECQCGLFKKPGFSFCRKCFRALPLDLRRDLYRKIGGGYEEAYDASVEYLMDA